MNCFDCKIPCEYSNPFGFCQLTICAKKGVELPNGAFEKGYQPADAMKALDEKIKKVSEKGTWDGVDVDKYMAELRGRDTELQQAASNLVDAVEKYVEPKPGDTYCSRNEVLMAKNKLKKLISE